MRTKILLAAAAASLLLPWWCRAQDQSQAQQTPPPAASNSAQAAQNPPAQVDPIVEAARRAREQKKEAAKAAKVFDNDNISGKGGVSYVGKAAAPTGEAAAESEAAAKAPLDEKTWRGRFAKLRHKLDDDKAELDVMRREWGQLFVQFYTDPVKGMQQGLTRSDVNEKQAKIDGKKKQIEADEQAISDAEDELRKSGGDPGWAR